jgi:hypothetical protein
MDDNPLLMKRKSITLSTTVFFLLFTLSCAHTPQRPSSTSPHEEISSQQGISRALRTSAEEEKWWQKPENEFMVMMLIVLGIAIAAGASILIVSSSGGLTVGISK